MSRAKSAKTVLVLGAGVSGLSTGYLLLKNGFNVIIWAKDTSRSITSYKAAAMWYPYLCNPPDKATNWAKFTREFLINEIVRDPHSGCLYRKVVEVFESHVEDPWWKNAVTDFRRVTEDKLPAGYVDGYEVTGILTDTSIYLDYLLNKFRLAGGYLVQKGIKNIHEALSHYDLVINCTGLGSRYLFDDKKVRPIRGQFVKVKPNGFDYVLADEVGKNSLAVIIPRHNDIILGGTTQVDNWNLQIDPQDTKDILFKAALLNPKFKNVEIIDVAVGLRPYRSEIRLEIEKYGDKTIVHNYGHGGAGFTLSWGCAQEVVDIVKDLYGAKGGI